MTTQVPNWTNPTPPTPPKKRKTGRIIAGVIGLSVGGMVVVAIATGGSSDPGASSVAPAPSASQPQHKASKERADLVSFYLDDRSAYGVTDVWVKWTVVNHSSKPSDYIIQWEAINPKTGVRIANGTEYTYNVQPGQTAKDEDVTTLGNGQATINITVFDRTQAYN